MRTRRVAKTLPPVTIAGALQDPECSLIRYWIQGRQYETGIIEDNGEWYGRTQVKGFGWKKLDSWRTSTREQCAEMALSAIEGHQRFGPIELFRDPRR